MAHFVHPYLFMATEATLFGIAIALFVYATVIIVVAERKYKRDMDEIRRQYPELKF